MGDGPCIYTRVSNPINLMSGSGHMMTHTPGTLTATQVMQIWNCTVNAHEPRDGGENKMKLTS